MGYHPWAPKESDMTETKHTEREKEWGWAERERKRKKKKWGEDRGGRKET